MNFPQSQTIQPDSPSQKHLINWLQNYTQNKSNSTQPHIQSQLQSITQSYKNSQEKLLTLEKQLSLQTIYNEKQRSMIEILKYILNDNMDDSTILTYISGLDEELSGEDQKKYSIREQLQQMRIMIQRRKGLRKKSESLRDGAIKQMKKQIRKLNEVKKELMEDLESLVNEKDELEEKMGEMKNRNTKLEQQNRELKKQTQQIYLLQQQNIQLQNNLNQSSQNHQTNTTKLQQLLQLSDTLPLPSLIHQIQKKLNNYRKSCSQLSKKTINSSKTAQLHSILKLFLPAEAQKIAEEYEKTHQDCLLTELENICRLEKNKYLQLQNCQQEMWRWRVKLLREDETWASSRGRISSHRETQRDISQFKMQ